VPELAGDEGDVQRIGEAPAHLEWLGHTVAEGALELGPALLQSLQPGVAVGQEAGDGDHDPVPVGTRDEQPGGLFALVHVKRR